jgi:predicted transcriptional regulator
LNPDQVKTARRLYDERELTVEEIGRILGVSRTSIYRALGRDPSAAAAKATVGREGSE